MKHREAKTTNHIARTSNQTVRRFYACAEVFFTHEQSVPRSLSGQTSNREAERSMEKQKGNLLVALVLTLLHYCQGIIRLSTLLELCNFLQQNASLEKCSEAIRMTILRTIRRCLSATTLAAIPPPSVRSYGRLWR